MNNAYISLKGQNIAGRVVRINHAISQTSTSFPHKLKDIHLHANENNGMQVNCKYSYILLSSIIYRINFIDIDLLSWFKRLFDPYSSLDIYINGNENVKDEDDYGCLIDNQSVTLRNPYSEPKLLNDTLNNLITCNSIPNKHNTIDVNVVGMGKNTYNC